MTVTARTLVDLDVPAPVEEVWAALRDPDLVARWFGWDHEGLAAEIDEIFVGLARADDATHTLAWADGDRFRLGPTDDGARTHLVVERPVTGHADVQEIHDLHDPVDEGWISFSQQLRYWFTERPDGARRTVTTVGVDLGTDDDPLLGRLGLRPLGDEPVGSRHDLHLPDGPVGAEIFFQTDLQLGLALAEAGDPLLVVARTPPAAAPPNGTAMFVLSTYGLDDDAFAEVERRWTAWWGEGSPSS